MFDNAFPTFKNALHHIMSFFQQQRSVVASKSIGKNEISVLIIEFALIMRQDFGV